MFVSSRTSRPALGPRKPPIFPVIMDLAVKITIHLLLVPRLRINGAKHLLHLCSFIVSSEKNFVIYFTMSNYSHVTKILQQKLN